MFWWSGGDITKDKLRYQLDELIGGGIGGTIDGYSHLPDGRLDHGDPAPFSEGWWELFTWFVDESAKRGLSVDVQDYGIIGPVLRSIAPRTARLYTGSLFNITQTVTAADEWSYSVGTAVGLIDSGLPGRVACEDDIVAEPYPTKFRDDRMDRERLRRSLDDFPARCGP